MKLELNITSILVGLSFLLPLTAHAEWTGNIGGEQILDGDNKGSRIRFEMSNPERPFDQTVYADYLRSDASGSGFGIGYEPKYWFSDKTYVFGLTALSTSGNDAVDYIGSVGAGVGVDIINTQSRGLSATLGATQTINKFDSSLLADGVDDTTSSLTSYATLSGDQQISSLFKLTLDLDYSLAEQFTAASAAAGIKLRIPGGSVVYSYKLKDEKPDGGDSFRTQGSSISFEYGF